VGVALFRRTARGLEMTAEGNLLATHVDRGLDSIETGLTQVARRVGSVKVALLPMFSSRWLSPRPGSLLEKHPDLQLSIQNHNNRFARMSNPAGYADVGVQWGRGSWNGFQVTRLWREQLVVVCSPDYLQAHPINKPSDLARCMLLHVDDTRMWEEWLETNEQQLSNTQPQMMLEDRHFQLSSTINGLGVSLFASWLVENELLSGDLVDPFKAAVPTSFAYYLIVPKGNETQPEVQQFCDWILDECNPTVV